jgi:DNA-binding response OmpR family regulator
MVVDDDSIIRKFLCSILEKAGYQVSEAQNGKVAMKLFRNFPADVIIMDLVMPEKEGIETIMEFSRDFPAAKIIAITGGLKGETELLLNASRDLGASRAFKKPLDAKTILEAVKELAG